MALKYGKKVYVNGFIGGVIRIIRDNKEVITHLDVEVGGVVDRYSISDIKAPLKHVQKI